MKVPHCIGTYFEGWTDGRLVIKYTFFELIRFAGIVENQALVIFGARIHDRLKHRKCWYDTKE
jgi:hypothetical protein